MINDRPDVKDEEVIRNKGQNWRSEDTTPLHWVNVENDRNHLKTSYFRQLILNKRFIKY